MLARPVHKVARLLPAASGAVDAALHHPSHTADHETNLERPRRENALWIGTKTSPMYAPQRKLSARPKKKLPTVNQRNAASTVSRNVRMCKLSGTSAP